MNTIKAGDIAKISGGFSGLIWESVPFELSSFADCGPIGILDEMADPKGEMIVPAIESCIIDFAFKWDDSPLPDWFILALLGIEPYAGYRERLENGDCGE